MEDAVKRIPPNSLEAEQSVIGSMIMDREAIAAALEYIDARDFYNPDLKLIFSNIVVLYNSGTSVDIVTLGSQIEKEGQLEQIGGIGYLSKLAMAVPSYVRVREYAKIVKEKATLRRLIKAGNEIINSGYDGKMDLDIVLNSAEEKIFNIMQDRKFEEFSSVTELINPTLNNIVAAHNNGDSITGISTGFVDLDVKTAGFQKSDMILIAARPSMGKTAFALNIAQYAAVKEKKSVAVFSLEMSKEQLVNRMLCSESMIDAQKVRTGRLEDQDWTSLLSGAAILNESKIYIDDTPGIGIAEMKSKCRKLKIEHGLDIIFIDYLQLMSGSGNSESRQQEISEISRSLKALAREMEAPVVALSQLSRACEARADHRPMLSDLRESGAIEQDADVVMFLYRDEYYNKDTDAKGLAELLIAKQRNGPTGTVELAWLGQYAKFMNHAG